MAAASRDIDYDDTTANPDESTFPFTIFSPTRTLYLAASNSAEMHAWMDVLKMAIAHAETNAGPDDVESAPFSHMGAGEGSGGGEEINGIGCEISLLCQDVASCARR